MSAKYKNYMTFREYECQGPAFVAAEVGKNCYHKRYPVEFSPRAIDPDIIDPGAGGFICDRIREFIVEMMNEELEEAKKEYGDQRFVLVADPEGKPCICTEKGCVERLEYSDEYTELDVVCGEEVLICYNPEDIISFGRSRYVTREIVILEIDDDGNDCSINEETFNRFLDFCENNYTTIRVDGRVYGAFRLD